MLKRWEFLSFFFVINYKVVIIRKVFNLYSLGVFMGKRLSRTLRTLKKAGDMNIAAVPASSGYRVAMPIHIFVKRNQGVESNYPDAYHAYADEFMDFHDAGVFGSGRGKNMAEAVCDLGGILTRAADFCERKRGNLGDYILGVAERLEEYLVPDRMIISNEGRRLFHHVTAYRTPGVWVGQDKVVPYFKAVLMGCLSGFAQQKGSSGKESLKQLAEMPTGPTCYPALTEHMKERRMIRDIDLVCVTGNGPMQLYPRGFRVEIADFQDAFGEKPYNQDRVWFSWDVDGFRGKQGGFIRLGKEPYYFKR